MLQRYGLGWWALQLPAVRFIVGSSSFRQFEQRVSMNAWHTQLKQSTCLGCCLQNEQKLFNIKAIVFYVECQCTPTREV